MYLYLLEFQNQKLPNVSKLCFPNFYPPPKGMTNKRSNLSNPPSKDGNKMHDEKPLQKFESQSSNNGRRKKKNLPRKISLLLLSLFSNHFWKRCANSDSRFFKYSPTNHITSSVAMTNTNPYYNTNMMVIYTINDGLMKTFLKKRICYIYIIWITARNCKIE